MPQNLNPSLMGGGGLISYDGSGFDEDSRRSRDVMVPAGHDPAWDERIMMLLGLLQRPGEPNGAFWGRGQFANFIPPSLREPLGQDIQLPSSPKSAAVRTAVMRKLSGK